MSEGLQQFNTIALLLENLKDADWKESKICNSDNSVSWLLVTYVEDPAILMDKDDYCLGLSRSGYWVVEVNGCVDLLDGNDMRSLWPCLKTAHDKFTNLLKQGFTKLNLSSSLIKTFPYRSVVMSALKGKSDFWSDLALDWLNCLEIDGEVFIELEDVVDALWATQKTRQKASKLLKKAKT